MTYPIFRDVWADWWVTLCEHACGWAYLAVHHAGVRYHSYRFV